MCELLGVSAEHPIQLKLGWEEFALHGSHKFGNPDGWGVAYFAYRDALLLREPKPAAKSAMVKFLAHHAPASQQIVSHIRRATMGAHILENTQPFVRHLAGRAHLFAHNGHVPDVEIPAGGLFLYPMGDTDSERIFLQLLCEIEKLWKGKTPPLRERFLVIEEFAKHMREHGTLNFLYGDGQSLFAHGHRHTIPGEALSNDPGLYVLERDTDEANDVQCTGFSCDGSKGPLAIIATVPLDDRPWQPLAHGEVACFEKGHRVL